MGAAAATLSLGEAIGILHLGCRTCFLLAGSGEMENKMDAMFLLGVMWELLQESTPPFQLRAGKPLPMSSVELPAIFKGRFYNPEPETKTANSITLHPCISLESFLFIGPPNLPCSPLPQASIKVQKMILKRLLPIRQGSF